MRYFLVKVPMNGIEAAFLAFGTNNGVISFLSHNGFSVCNGMPISEEAAKLFSENFGLKTYYCPEPETKNETDTDSDSVPPNTEA